MLACLREAFCTGPPGGLGSLGGTSSRTFWSLSCRKPDLRPTHMYTSSLAVHALSKELAPSKKENQRPKLTLWVLLCQASWDSRPAWSAKASA
eukprot:9836392-Lingulodinium_polyedra.AAC.1